MTRKQRHPHAARPAAVKPVARPYNTAEKALIALAGLGLLITAYLSWTALFGSLPAFCSAGSGCEIVQGSRWSRFLGVPVAVWGLLTYAVLLGLTLSRGKPQPRWQRLWSVAVVGLSISLYLTLAGAIALQAFCAWCLASQLVILAIFVIVHLQRPRATSSFTWGPFLAKHAIVLVAVLGVMHASAAGWLDRQEDPRLAALAKHLDATGAKFYGAFWCPNCRQQKDRFGPAQAHLPYVECTPNGRQGPVAFACVNENIVAYPTWIIRGQRYTETLDTEELAQRSGFRWAGE